MSKPVTSMSQYIRKSETDRPTFAKTCVQTPVSVEVLIDILSYPRRAGSWGEQLIISKYIETLPGIKADGYGNFWLLIEPQDGGTVTTVFSAHTDTVHGANEVSRYKVTLSKAWAHRRRGGVLGADDGTGMWILLNLIQAKVPGLYIFHREEECGGGGSSYIAEKHGHLLKEFKHCIAFDRKGTTDVITYQGGDRCCSEAFAKAFADQLNLGTDFEFAGDDSGSFTDSANYTHLIPECTNLAVGYYAQHTDIECQDLTFATRLVNKLIAIDFSQLPAERDVNEVDSLWGGWNWNSYTGYGSKTKGRSAGHRDLDDYSDYDPRVANPRSSDPFIRLTELVSAYPAEIADMLEQEGWDAESLLDHLVEVYGCEG